MNRNLIVLIFVLLCSLNNLTFAQNTASTRPNIVIITTDQQTANAMSCAGNQDLKTPAMDRLAANGVRFTRAYCAQPLCTPSRIAMYSGVMPHESGFIANAPEKDGIWPESLPVMGKIFKEGGYHTGYIGKWHLPIPVSKKEQHGFEYTTYTGRVDYSDAAIPSQCDQFFRENKSRPFLLVASFLNPHDICEWARNDNLKMDIINDPPEDESLLPTLPYNWKIQSHEPEKIREQQLSNARTYPSLNWNELQWRQYRWAYNRLVEKVDYYISLLLESLKKNGLEKNTVIVFTSDHGDGYAAHSWNQKQVLYEESTGIPFIISKIGEWASKTNDRLVNNGLDLIPTVCDFAGIKPPKLLKGSSIKGLIENQSQGWRDTLVIETAFADNEKLLGINGRSIITKQFKYIAYDKGKIREQLFDLKNDPGETKNLAVQTNHKKMLSAMRNYLLKWGRDNTDKFFDYSALK